MKRILLCAFPACVGLVAPTASAQSLQLPRTAALTSAATASLTSDAKESRADGDNQDDGAIPVTPVTGSRPLAVVGSIVPGVLLHGSGQWLLGRRKTAHRLLLAEAAGVGGVLGGLAGLAVTGASRYLVIPFAWATIAGVGLFGFSLIADIHATVLTDEQKGRAATLTAPVEVSVGYNHVYDPQFRYRNFFKHTATFRTGAWAFGPRLESAVDDKNYRLSADVAYRFVGPRPDVRSNSGSFVDAAVTATRHAYVSDGFAITTVEATARARLDLRDFDPHLSGGYVQLDPGLAVSSIRYDLPTDERELTDLLLMRMTYGIYLNRPTDVAGDEIALYYDHRHDGYAAGLKLTGLGSGVPGHFGTRARFWPLDDFGFSLEGEVGSALVGGLSLWYRERKQ